MDNEEMEKRNICQSMKEKSKETNNFLYLPRKIVIAFVEAMEKAHLYFSFKDYLKKCSIIKHDSLSDNIYHILSNTPGLESIFQKVEKDSLLHAVKERILEVEANRNSLIRYDYVDYLSDCKFIKSTLDMQHKFCVGSYSNNRQGNEQAPTNPIYSLVFRTREGKHVMNLNPEVELKHIRKSNPDFYMDYLVDFIPQLKYSYVKSRMVRVTNVPFGAFVRDIKEFFSSCGVIKYVKISRGDKFHKSQTVHVVFQKIEEADCAVQLSGKEMMAQGMKNAITVISTSGGLVPTSTLPLPKDVLAASRVVSAVEKAEDVGNMLAQVLEKYWHYCQKDFKDTFSSALYS